jgi:hypothetical protein
MRERGQAKAVNVCFQLCPRRWLLLPLPDGARGAWVCRWTGFWQCARPPKGAAPQQQQLQQQQHQRLPPLVAAPPTAAAASSRLRPPRRSRRRMWSTW